MKVLNRQRKILQSGRRHLRMIDHKVVLARVSQSDDGPYPLRSEVVQIVPGHGRSGACDFPIDKPSEIQTLRNPYRTHRPIFYHSDCD